MKLGYFKEIYNEVFADPAAWSEWFFGKIAEDDIMIAKDGCGRPAASLLMEVYDFLFHGSVLPSGYVSCMATKPENRSRGFASGLMRESLAGAFERGYAFCELIPAEDHLYEFYRQFSYAPVFYVDQERYTSLHRFATGDAAAIEPSYDVFRRLEDKFGCGPVHSAVQFANVLKDNAFSSGHEVVFMEDAEGAQACIFATYSSSDPEGGVLVRSLLADNDTVGESVLAELRRRVGERPIAVWTPPLSGLKEFLRPRGMLRIVDAAKVLAALAAAHKGLEFSAVVSDPDIEANNAAFIVSGGECRKVARIARPDLDVDIETLAAVLFGSEKTGRIFGLPTRRPYMSLMLD